MTRKNYGKLLPWIEAHVRYQGKACLTWPFGLSSGGRPMVRRGGDPESAPRIMCELAHGPAPTPQHEAAHSCGKGHKACMSPRHIWWATPMQNSAERIAHGNSGRGADNSMARLSLRQVKAIRHRLAKGHKGRAIAKDYNVHESTISAIKVGVSWASQNEGGVR